MGVFQFTGLVLTQQNYTKYRKKSLQGEPLSYYPEGWRPPKQWYIDMGLGIPAELRKVQKTKRSAGRPKGSGAKNRRINFRTTDTFIRQLYWIREHSQVLKDKSEAAIIEHLVDEHVLMQQLYNIHTPRFE